MIFIRTERFESFSSAVDHLVNQWPTGTYSATVNTTKTHTRILRTIAVSVDIPQVLLPGGGATAASWAPVARLLTGRRSVIAPDIPGDAGNTTLTTTKLTQAQMHDWLDEVLDKVGANEIDLAGHSYGGWLALSYALARPGRVRNLTLVAPSMCFAPLSFRYVLHALPVVLRPSTSAARRLLNWETADYPPDPSSADVYITAADQRWPGVPRPTRPTSRDLGRLNVKSVNLVLAGDDRSQDNTTCKTNAQKYLSQVHVVDVPGATHHSVVDRGSKTIATTLLGSHG